MSKDRINSLITVSVNINLAKAPVEDLEYLRDLIEEELEARSQYEMKQTLIEETSNE